MFILALVVLFALLGTPVFAVIGGATELLWLVHDDPSMRVLRFVAPDVLDERFTGNPVTTTVPLFTLIGYLMAQSKAPERIVRVSNAFFGWLPGGLAIVCIVASAFFTTLTGGSAVTIVAIGALLYPALVARGYPKDYSLGLVMTGGSLGLLLPPSVPVIVYSFVAGVDFTKAFKALLLPGLLVLVFLSLHAVWVAHREKIPRSRPDLREMLRSFWVIKWEAGTPLLILTGLGTGLAAIDEIAAVTAVYVVVIEKFIYRDLAWRDLPRIIGRSVALSGAVILIMATSVSLTNYMISEQIPTALFDYVTALGVTESWHFILVLNVFLYIQGMVMDGFSAIFVAVPLLIPFAAAFALSPFHLASMFLLNLEIAYLSPPLGQNLFVTSFRFGTPMTRLFRISLPFLTVLTAALAALILFPEISTVGVQSDIQRAREEALRLGMEPFEARTLTCVQEDPNAPKECDRKAEQQRSDPDVESLFRDEPVVH